MSRPQIRANQLITTFGPGAMVDLPEKSIIIGGLDTWSYEKDRGCEIEEPRLSAKVARILRRQNLGFQGMSIRLRRPPPATDLPFRPGVTTPGITGYEFPHWYIVQEVHQSPEKYRRRRLVYQDELHNSRFRNGGKLHSVVPIRFVRACKNGHVGDIHWRNFVHRGEISCQRDLWIEERGTTGDLGDVWIVCDCGSTRTISDAAGHGALGICNGSRPWLDDSEQGCTESNRLLVRTASNAYFPQTLPVISIPDGLKEVEAAVLDMWEECLVKVTSPEKLPFALEFSKTAADRLAPFSHEEIMEQICRIRDGKEAEGVAKPVKQIEFEALASAAAEHQTDKPDGDFFVRELAAEHWQAPMMAGVEKVVQVHRLREVVALLGFTRFEPESADVTGELDMQVKRAPIVRKPKWMPVSENRGEGVFIQFKTEAIDAWAASPGVIRRSQELAESLEKWQAVHPLSPIEFPGISYIMLHSLSHLLLTAISLECGYPLSSVRERIYAPDARGNMQGCYGLLLYTASAGSEGTLGGLVHAARDIRRHMLRAAQIGTLCSNDPVCSSGVAGTASISRITGCACHGCLYVPETSCERFNQFLDRSLVIPTLNRHDCAFLSL